MTFHKSLNLFVPQFLISGDGTIPPGKPRLLRFILDFSLPSPSHTQSLSDGDFTTLMFLPSLSFALFGENDVPFWVPNYIFSILFCSISSHPTLSHPTPISSVLGNTDPGLSAKPGSMLCGMLFCSHSPTTMVCYSDIREDIWLVPPMYMAFVWV